MDTSRSEGLVWLVRSQQDPRSRWKEERLDQLPSSHHLAWLDIDGDSKKELFNAPAVGLKSAAPTYQQDMGLVAWYPQSDWQRHVINTGITGILHRVRPVRWDRGPREQLIVASSQGITLYRALGNGTDIKWETLLISGGPAEGKPLRSGASDVAVGQFHGKRFLASIEPSHGNQVVIYTERASGNCERHVLYSELVQGHEIAVADFDADGSDDIVAGDQSPNTAGIHVFYAPNELTDSWEHRMLDAGGMAASSCAAGDINGDDRTDIVCIGSATANIKWYENLGTN